MKNTRGASLIEILVTVVVLAVGLLAMAGLLANALKSNQSAAMRTQAIAASYFLMDTLRAHRQLATTNAFDTVGWACDPPADAALPEQRALAEMLIMVRAQMGEAAQPCVRISCTPAQDGEDPCSVVEGENCYCSVAVRWDDRLASRRDEAVWVEVGWRSRL